MDLPHIILLATEVAAETAAPAAEPGVLGTLGIDLKLFIAQMVNFGIVVFILWKWVFRPVGGALEKRRQRIESSLQEVEAIEQRIQSFEQEHDERIKQSRKEAESIVQKAMTNAEELKAQIRQEAQNEAERILSSARASIEAEKKQALAEIRREVAELTFLAAEKVLDSEVDREKNKELVEEMLGDIKSVDNK